MILCGWVVAPGETLEHLFLDMQKFQYSFALVFATLLRILNSSCNLIFFFPENADHS